MDQKAYALGHVSTDRWKILFCNGQVVSFLVLYRQWNADLSFEYTSAGVSES